MNKYHKYTNEDLEFELIETRSATCQTINPDAPRKSREQTARFHQNNYDQCLAEIMSRRVDNSHNPEGITFDVDKKTDGTQQPTARIGKIDLFF